MNKYNLINYIFTHIKYSFSIIILSIIIYNFYLGFIDLNNNVNKNISIEYWGVSDTLFYTKLVLITSSFLLTFFLYKYVLFLKIQYSRKIKHFINYI